MVTFFIFVRPWPGYALVALAAVTALGIFTTWLDPAGLDSSLGMLLFVQMFLASSGFMASARRGHFDPLLIHGRRRAAVLAAHCAVSILPGAMAWLVLVLAASAMGSAIAASAMYGTRLAALAIVSGVAWAVGYALPRGLGGVLWIGALLIVLLRHSDLLPAAGAPISPAIVLRTAGTLVLCPFLLLGGQRPIAAAVVVVALAVVCALTIGVWRTGRRLDVYLVERS